MLVEKKRKRRRVIVLFSAFGSVVLWLSMSGQAYATDYEDPYFLGYSNTGTLGYIGTSMVKDQWGNWVWKYYDSYPYLRVNGSSTSTYDTGSYFQAPEQYKVFNGNGGETTAKGIHYDWNTNTTDATGFHMVAAQDLPSWANLLGANWSWVSSELSANKKYATTLDSSYVYPSFQMVSLGDILQYFGAIKPIDDGCNYNTTYNGHYGKMLVSVIVTSDPPQASISDNQGVYYTGENAQLNLTAKDDTWNNSSHFDALLITGPNGYSHWVFGSGTDKSQMQWEAGGGPSGSQAQASCSAAQHAPWNTYTKSVNFNTNGLADGTYTAHYWVSDWWHRDSNEATVSFKVVQSRGSLDTPANGATIVGPDLSVSGWAADITGVSKVDLLADGNEVGQLHYGDSRPDVYNAYPIYNNQNAGFDGTFNISNSWTPGQTYTLTAKVTRSDGSTYVLGGQQVTYVPTRGNLDQPANGTTVIGANPVNVEGWVTSTYGVNSVDILVDGKYVGTASYGDGPYRTYANSSSSTVLGTYANIGDAVKSLASTPGGIVKDPSGHNLFTEPSSSTGTFYTYANASSNTIIGTYSNIGDAVASLDAMPMGVVKNTSWAYVYDAPYGSAFGNYRSDVYNAYPDYNNYNAGFDYQLKFDGYQAGQYTIEAEAHLDNGTSVIVGSKTINLEWPTVNLTASPTSLETGQTATITASVPAGTIDSDETMVIFDQTAGNIWYTNPNYGQDTYSVQVSYGAATTHHYIAYLRSAANTWLSGSNQSVAITWNWPATHIWATPNSLKVGATTQLYANIDSNASIDTGHRLLLYDATTGQNVAYGGWGSRKVVANVSQSTATSQVYKVYITDSTGNIVSGGAATTVTWYTPYLNLSANLSPNPTTTNTTVTIKAYETTTGSITKSQVWIPWLYKHITMTNMGNGYYQAQVIAPNPGTYTLPVEFANSDGLSRTVDLSLSVTSSAVVNTNSDWGAVPSTISPIYEGMPESYSVSNVQPTSTDFPDPDQYNKVPYFTVSSFSNQWKVNQNPGTFNAIDASGAKNLSIWNVLSMIQSLLPLRYYTPGTYGVGVQSTATLTYENWQTLCQSGSGETCTSTYTNYYYPTRVITSKWHSTSFNVLDHFITATASPVQSQRGQVINFTATTAPIPNNEQGDSTKVQINQSLVKTTNLFTHGLSDYLNPGYVHQDWIGYWIEDLPDGTYTIPVTATWNTPFGPVTKTANINVQVSGSVFHVLPNDIQTN